MQRNISNMPHRHHGTWGQKAHAELYALQTPYRQAEYRGNYTSESYLRLGLGRPIPPGGFGLATGGSGLGRPGLSGLLIITVVSPPWPQ